MACKPSNTIFRHATDAIQVHSSSSTASRTYAGMGAAAAAPEVGQLAASSFIACLDQSEAPISPAHLSKPVQALALGQGI